MRSREKSQMHNQTHIIDDSGHNFDEAVINSLTDLAHDEDEGRTPTQHREDDQLDSFFDVPDDL